VRFISQVFCLFNQKYNSKQSITNKLKYIKNPTVRSIRTQKVAYNIYVTYSGMFMEKDWHEIAGGIIC
jgi:hypothetical protein